MPSPIYNDEYLSPEVESSYFNKPVKSNYYPETVLISITTHGAVDNTKKTIFTEKIPNSKVILVNATAPGVCNYTNESQIQDINDLLIEEFSKFNKKEDIGLFVKSVIPDLKPMENQIYKDRLRDKNKTVRQKRYTDTFHEKSYNYQEITQNKPIYYKEYSINNEEDDERKTRKNKDNTISVLNLPNGTNDLLDIIVNHSSREQSRIITLNEIIDHLNSNGAKNIIIFDFSCNDFGYNTTPREYRNKKRAIEREHDIKYVNKKIRREYKKKSQRRTRKNSFNLPSLTLRSTKSINSIIPKKTILSIHKNTRKVKSI
jgi:hypothetical protein